MSSPGPLTPPLSPRLKQQLALAAGRLGAGDPAEAARIAEEVTRQAPGAADAWHILAVALAQRGLHEDAYAPFQRAAALDPDNPHLLANFATALRRVGRLDDAAGLWRRAVDLAPAFGQAWLDLGLAELDLGRHAEAEGAFRHATACLPRSAPAWHGLASALDARDRPVEAEAALRQALACDPRQPRVLMHLGHILRRQARVDEALVCYAEARRMGAPTPELLDAEAGTLLDSGQIDAAIAAARQLTAAYPDFAPGQTTLAGMLWEYGDGAGDDPLAGFAATVDAHPDDAQLRYAYAQLLQQAGQGEAALEQMRALRRRDDQPAFRRYEAAVLDALGRHEEAGRIYAGLYAQQALRTPDFLNACTRHLLRTGQWKLAAARAEEALKQDPDNQEAWAYLGTAWRLLGDAREFWLCDYERLITLVDVDTPAGYVDVGAFLGDLKATLLPLHHASRAPLRQTLRHGTQTPGNLFGRMEPAIHAVERGIQAAAERWIATLPEDDAHPFLRRKVPRIAMRGAWSVRLVSTGYHVNHIHHQGWISSAFYVFLPPVMDDAGTSAGSIGFGQPPADLGLKLAPRRVLHPRAGSLALFPSSMWHGTVPFADDAFRLTVACDMVPEA